MKKSLLILLAIIFAINLNIQAEDFSAVYNGVTIYYNITSSTSPYEVAVTYLGSTYYSYSNEYSGAVSIPNSVLYNGNYYTVTSISISAFDGCSGLTSITIPNSVNYIYSGAFAYCSGLTSITIPNSVTFIGTWTFYDCNNLNSISIPNSVTYIGYGAFGETPWYNSLPDGVVYINNVLYNYKGIMPENTSINIQSGIVCISGGAFFGCSELTSVTIPNSVIEIHSETFRYCSGLTSITIPNSVTFIGYSVFQNCTGLTSITIPNSITNIDDSLFNDCSALTSINIPNSVTSIGNSAFYGCSGLTSITIPNSVISIGNQAFQGCSGLTSITIPSSVTNIGDSVFSGCSGLTLITIPNSVTSIGNWTFSDCSGLNSITIPNSVTSIGSSAFNNCYGLTSIISKAINPPYIQSSSFSGVNDTIPIYVPCNSLDLYQQDEYWSYFTNFKCDPLGLCDELKFNISTKLYPNPTNNKSKLEVNGLSSEADVMVYDMIGRVIQTHKINKGKRELDIDLSGYAKGVYSIRIMNDNINQTKKLIVQ